MIFEKLSKSIIRLLVFGYFVAENYIDILNAKLLKNVYIQDKDILQSLFKVML